MSITVRFYAVEKANEAGLSLQEALQHIVARDHVDRQYTLTAGYTVRLERYEKDGGELAGEFTRVRTTNFPFEVRPDGPEPLPTDGPIGDGVAFRFRLHDHTLAMQYDNRIVSPGRAMAYIRHFDARGEFNVTPKMDPENWRKFRANPVRKLRVGIASPDHLGDIEDEGAAVSRSFRELGEAYNAPVITLELGMGNRRGALAESAKTLAQSMIDLVRFGQADLRSLRAAVKEEGEPTEEINLLDEILSDKFDFEYPQNDPERNYALRRDFLRERLRAHGLGE